MNDWVTVLENQSYKVVQAQGQVVVTVQNQPTKVVFVAQQGLPGPPGADGAPGADGDPGPPGADGDKYYPHTQSVPSTVWNINHNLNKRPSVTVYDTAGDQHEGEVTHIDANNTQLVFSSAFAGVAYLN